jgi:hypothetical protein
MKNILLTIIVIFALHACKKEEKPYSEWTFEECFERLSFDCSQGNTNNYFSGQLGEKDFCMYESLQDTFWAALAFSIVTSEPYIVVGGNNSGFAEAVFYHLPKDNTPYAGDINLRFGYKDTSALNTPFLADFYLNHFKEGHSYTFSRIYNSHLPEKKNSDVQGIEISITAYNGITTSGNYYSTAHIPQPADSYCICKKAIYTDDTAYLEFEVKATIAVGTMRTDLTKEIEGTFYYEVRF